MALLNSKAMLKSDGQPKPKHGRKRWLLLMLIPPAVLLISVLIGVNIAVGNYALKTYWSRATNGPDPWFAMGWSYERGRGNVPGMVYRREYEWSVGTIQFNAVLTVPAGNVP